MSKDFRATNSTRQQAHTELSDSIFHFKMIDLESDSVLLQFFFFQNYASWSAA